MVLLSTLCLIAALWGVTGELIITSQPSAHILHQTVDQSPD